MGCNKGLWEVQPALRERRERLPPGFRGEEGSWGKSQGRMLRGVAFEVAMNRVGAWGRGRHPEGESTSSGAEMIKRGVWLARVPHGASRGASTWEGPPVFAV